MSRKPWYATWVDFDSPPSQKQLDRWDVEWWVERIDDFYDEAILDLEFTLAMVPEDRLLKKVQWAEENAKRRIHFISDIPEGEPINTYQPQRIKSSIWLDKRAHDLKERRERFATMHWFKTGEFDQSTQDRRIGNAICQVFENHLEQLKKYGAGDWLGPTIAQQEYVQSLEGMQLLLVAGARNRPVSYVNTTAMNLRNKLNWHHKKIIVENEEYDLGLAIRPWNVDLGIDPYTQEEFDKIDRENGWPTDRELWGVPILQDGPIADRAQRTKLWDLTEERRIELDKMALNFHASRYARVNGWIRAERKIWGQVRQSIGRIRGHGLWEEDESYAL